MEAFTLVVWFMLGSEMKVERIENLTRAECIAKLAEVLATGRLSATCRTHWHQPPIMWRGRISGHGASGSASPNGPPPSCAAGFFGGAS